MNTVLTITEAFKNKRVVILGDAVADQFVSGTITRVSREAPVFIMRHDKTETRAGGASNAAVNVASLGGTPHLIGLLGTDADGDLLATELERRGVNTDLLTRDAQIRTTTKSRVLAGQQYAPRHQVIRIDHENSVEIGIETRKKLADNLVAAAGLADVIVVSDYNYGVATPEIFERARQLAAECNIPLLIDSRFRLGAFPGATSATPNQEEIEQMLGEAMTDENCETVRIDLGLQALLVTCGSKGMRLYESGAAPQFIEAVGSSAAVDVTGAGDTVIAAYALGLASGLSFAEAARIANHAGGIVVMKKGTAAVTVDELNASLAATPVGAAKAN
jgi:rfaE bifunctional protein kinase chain/domain